MKNKIRNQFKNIRNSLSDAEVFLKSKKISKRLLKNKLLKKADTIMVYMAIGNEADMVFAIGRLMSANKKIAVPVTDAKTFGITPCYIEEDTVLKSGVFGVREPKILDIANKDDIDIVIVPGVAFDEAGNRIGFGKGCYDGFLKDFKGIKIGVCYQEQICGQVPVDEDDIPVDIIITDKRTIKAKKCCDTIDG